MDISALLAAYFGEEAQHALKPSVSVDVHALVTRAQQGDREAVAALYQLYSGLIYRYIAYRTPSTADAEDLTADVFIRMVRGLPNYRITEVPFEGWLYRIASARIADFYRKSGRQTNVALSEGLADHEPLPEEEVQQQQAFASVRSAMQQLSEEHQTILILRFVERKSHDEVAAILNKSMSAVKSAQHRALSHLATLLGSDQKIRHYLRGSHE